MRVLNHPILGKAKGSIKLTIYLDGKALQAQEGDTVASALIANGIKIHRYTRKHNKPRGVFCCIGRCSDCLMTIDGIPNVRSCVTPVRDGMRIKTQNKDDRWEGLE